MISRKRRAILIALSCHVLLACVFSSGDIWSWKNPTQAHREQYTVSAYLVESSSIVPTIKTNLEAPAKIQKTIQKPELQAETPRHKVTNKNVLQNSEAISTKKSVSRHSLSILKQQIRQQLIDILELKKKARYTRRSYRAHVFFVIDTLGKIKNIRLQQTTGSQYMDRVVIASIHTLSPVHLAKKYLYQPTEFSIQIKV